MVWNCYLFDFDYTIADSSQGIVECFNKAFAILGFPICDALQIKKTIGKSLRDSFVELQGEKSIETILNFENIYRYNSKSIMLNNTYLYEGVEDTFKRIKRNGAKIGIVSSKDSETIRNFLIHEKIEGYIDVIVGEGMTGECKPSGKPIEYAIEQLNSEKGKTVYIGDCDIDAEAAYNAKVDFIAVRTGVAESNWIEKCRYPIYGVCNSVTEFMESLQLI